MSNNAMNKTAEETEAIQSAIDAIPIYPIDNALLKSLDWNKYIGILRGCFVSGYLHRSLPTPATVQGESVWVEVPVSERLPDGSGKCWVVEPDGFESHHYKDYVRRHPEKFKSWLEQRTP